jgi:hypothetical protein
MWQQTTTWTWSFFVWVWSISYIWVAASSCTMYGSVGC